MESELRQMAFEDPLRQFLAPISPFQRKVPTIGEIRGHIEREIELINQQTEIFLARDKNCKKTINAILRRPGMFCDQWTEWD